MQLGILPEGRKQKEEKLTLVQTHRFRPKILLVSEAKEMYNHLTDTRVSL